MSWFRVDDQMAFHRKILKAGNEAIGAWVRMGAHSSAQNPTGFLSEEQALLIAGKEKVIERLVDAVLLERVAGGYALHDYHDWNPTAEQVATKREARAEAGRRGGQASAEQRRSKREAIASPEWQANGQLDEANAKQSRTPSPSPSPVPGRAEDPPVAPPEGGPPPPKSARRAAPERGARIPEAWQPGDATRAWWREKRFDDRDVAAALERFRFHFEAASGRTAMKANWDRALQGWLLRDAGDGKIAIRPREPERTLHLLREPPTEDAAERATEFARIIASAGVPQ